MPYSTIAQLPPYIKKLPKSVQHAWMSVFNASFKKYGEERAFAIANGWVKKRLKKKGTVYVGKSEDFVGYDYLTFDLTPENSELIVQNSEDGEIVLSAILVDNETDIRGRRFSESFLESLANQINTEGTTLPDIDHEELNQLLKDNQDVETLYTKLKSRKGILKSIRAKIVNGRLFISAFLDKRYRNHINKYKSLSIEAAVPRNMIDKNVFYGGKLLGFTFTNKPVNLKATIAA